MEVFRSRCGAYEVGSFTLCVTMDGIATRGGVIIREVIIALTGGKVCSRVVVNVNGAVSYSVPNSAGMVLVIADVSMVAVECAVVNAMIIAIACPVEDNAVSIG